MDRILKQIQDFIVKHQSNPQEMRQFADRLKKLAADAERTANFYSNSRWTK